MPHGGRHDGPRDTAQGGAREHRLREAAPQAPPAETNAWPEDPARRERATLLRSFEGSPLTAANFCALKGLAMADFDAQIALARRERDERARGGGGGGGGGSRA